MDGNSDSEEPNITSLEYAIKRSLLSRNKLAIIMRNPDGLIQYCCVECTYKCDEIKQLETHLLLHNKEYRYLCGICGTGLKRKEHLDRHTLEHQEVRPHVCSDCGKAFKRKEHMNIHKSIHSGDKSEQCAICNKSFYRKDHLRKHLQTHSKVFMEQNIHPLYDQVLVEIKQEMMDEEEDVKPLLSDIAVDDDMALGQEDIGENEQEEEMTEQEEQSLMEPDQSLDYKPVFPTKATKIERPYACYLCHKSYKRRDHLKIHSWTHIKKDKICSECGKAYHREEQLLAHMNTHLHAAYGAATNGGDPLSGDADQMDAHEGLNDIDDALLMPRAVKMSSESRPHECAVCQRRFKRKQHLKQHLNVHFKPHQPSVWCSVCGEGFLSNDKFEKHYCLRLAGVEVNGESCADNQPRIMPMAAKKENKYPREYMDVSELASVAAEHELPIPQRVFVCKYCTKPFKRKDHYKIHLSIHTGIKTCFCPTCGKGFYRKDHMQKHMQVHSKNRERPRRLVPDLFPLARPAAGPASRPDARPASRPDARPASRPDARPAVKEIKPEITIHAPASSKLRMPLQIKVPYQMVVSMDNGEQHAVTIDPIAATQSS